MAKLPNLNDAYALSSDDGIRALYDDWAHSYDAGFGEAMGYQLPRAVAIAFAGAGGCGPVLDFGAGTGLVADHLSRMNIGPLDGVDLSPEMLAVARNKNHYRTLSDANIFAPGHDLVPASYAGIVSAGTFTHGHVGPDGLRPLLAMAAPGATCALSVNAKHFAAAGFEAELAALEPVLAQIAVQDVRIYDDRAEEARRDDMAKILILKTR